MRLFLFLNLLSFQCFAQGLFYDEFNLRPKHLEGKETISKTLESVRTLLPFQLMQDLSFFRVRLAKHPTIVNREDEIQWIKHNVFLIKSLSRRLAAYKSSERVEELLDIFITLEREYKSILKYQSSLLEL